MRRIETLSAEQCRDLLDTVTVGRVVFTAGGLPAVLPITYVVDGETVVIRTAEGSRLAKAADDAVLTFEADEVHPGTRTGWSVVVTGHARLERNPDEQARIGADLQPWVPGIKESFIRIPLTMVTGRRITVA